MKLHEVDAVGRAALFTLLPDAPENVISLHVLHTGRCRVWGERDCVLIESDFALGEPHLIGSVTDSIVALLQERPEWTAANVASKIAGPVADALEGLGMALHQTPDIYLATATPPTLRVGHPARLLRAADAELVAEAMDKFAALDPALGQPGLIAAGSFDGDKLVSMAAITARTERFANVSAVTLQDWRGQGYATAAAAVLTAAVAGTRRQALWSCAESNTASLAIANALGYREIARRVYLVRDDKRSG
jgi:RimJ/RimL family protein N-acetyltransferase